MSLHVFDLSSGRSAASWLALLFVTILVSWTFWYLNVPGSLLIGPLLVAIGFGLAGAKLRVSKRAFVLAQITIGCMAAAAISPEVVRGFAEHWLLFTASIFAVLVASSVIGWLSSLWGVLPGKTSVWGMAPGGASAMVLMAEAFGGDPRLVAVMQYIRLIVAVLGASLVATLWIGSSGQAMPRMEWFPAIQPIPFLSVFLVGGLGAVAGWLVRLPGAFVLGPLLLAVALKMFGLVEFQLPLWFLAIAFVLVGWNVGLAFRSETILLAWRAMPQILLSILALLVFCAAVGWFLHVSLGVDLLTAYLATTPGGLETVVVIAAGIREVDLGLVITLQTLRLLIVMLAGPLFVRFLLRRLDGRG